MEHPSYWSRKVLLTALIPLVLYGCGGGGGTNASLPQAGSGGPPQVDLLAGDPGALAVHALPDVEPSAVPTADMAGDLLLTRIRLVLDPGATVAEFNAAARVARAIAIASASPGARSVSLAIPRMAGGAALPALLDELETLPGITAALPARQFAGSILPGTEQGGVQAPDQLAHLLPTRFPAAWNAAFRADGTLLPAAADCTPSEATVLIADLFGSAPPNTGNQLAPFANSQRFGRFSAGPEDHGWQVAAVLGSAFDDLMPTGGTALPQCVDLVLVDLLGLDYIDVIDTLRRAVNGQLAFARMIVNLSVGYSLKFCGPNLDGVCTSANLDATPRAMLQREIESRIWAAIEWRAITSDSLDARMLLVQAAGNEAAERPSNGGLGLIYPGISDARAASPVALAGLLDLPAFDTYFSPTSLQARWMWTHTAHPSLLLDDATVEGFGTEIAARLNRIPTFRNLLVVGSTTTGALPSDLTRSAFSNEPATLYAVGEEVPGLGGILLDGTSFAAPQVAALAAWLWSVSDYEEQGPVLETVDLIRSTSVADRLIDAYAATLALDAVVNGTAPGVREALLDVNGDGAFDEADLFRFNEAYGLDDPGTPTIPESRDYSRFDLNGDGSTGGIPTATFDLDRSGPPGAGGISSVDREIEGYPITFNEATVSDIQILCYYAYSTVYAGGSPTPAQEAVRTELLGPEHCAGVRMDLVLPSSISGSAQIDIRIERPDGSGGFLPAPDLLLDLVSSCGALAASSGRTDASGMFSTSVGSVEGCSSISISATARADQGSQPLAQRTATARVNGITFGDNVTLCRQSMIQAFNASGISTVVGNLSIERRESCREDEEGPVTETALNVSLAGLLRVGGHLTIDGPVSGISASGLSEVGGNFTLAGITGSANPSFPALLRVDGSLTVSENTGLSDANYPMLEYVGDSLFVEGNVGMTTARFPLLEQVFTGWVNSGGIFITDNPNMIELAIGPVRINTANGGLFITGNAVLSSLMGVSCELRGGGVWIMDNPTLPESEVERFRDCLQEE